MWSMSKTKLSCLDQSDLVQSMTKTKQDNDVTNHINVIYAENETKLLWSIGPGAVDDENRIGQ